MLLRLAWRNIWRNIKRSFIIISAISAGILCGLFASAIMFGMGDSLVNSTIDRDLGHLQIHSKKFEDDKLISDTISNSKKMLEELEQYGNIEGVTLRIILEGMGSSASTSAGLKIIGINPEDEKSVTSIHRQLVTGNYLEGSNIRGNQILIGEKLADNFGIKEKSKIVLTFQGFDGSIIYAAFRVSGIFRTESSLFDKTNVFIKKEELYTLLDATNFAHEIAIRASSVQAVESIYKKLNNSFPQVSLKTWKELAPDLKLMDELIGVQLNIFLGIILFALLFGITNTMLMSVLERVREFGVLMAIGMKRRRVFVMIIVETILLSLVGGLIGIMFSAALISYFGSTGINLSAFAEGFTAWNLSPVLQPELPFYFYVTITIMIIITAIISAVYPAIKAVKLKPAKAIKVY